MDIFFIIYRMAAVNCCGDNKRENRGWRDSGAVGQWGRAYRYPLTDYRISLGLEGLDSLEGLKMLELSGLLSGYQASDGQTVRRQGDQRLRCRWNPDDYTFKT